jgi:hypothetical protein
VNDLMQKDYVYYRTKPMGEPSARVQIPVHARTNARARRLQ